jgi:hypothetical protein
MSGRLAQSDTDPIVTKMTFDRLRRMSITERACITHDLSRMVDELCTAGVRERYPYADDNEVRMRVGVLRVGPQLIADAFGWTDPATTG